MGRGVDYSPPSSAEVKDGWSFTIVPPILLHGGDRDKFNFALPVFKSVNRDQPNWLMVSTLLHANAGIVIH
jgi:hypothetical protein